MKLKEKLLNKKVFSLIIPIALQQFLLSMVSAGDSLMLGFVDGNLKYSPSQGQK